MCINKVLCNRFINICHLKQYTVYNYKQRKASKKGVLGDVLSLMSISFISEAEGGAFYIVKDLEEVLRYLPDTSEILIFLHYNWKILEVNYQIASSNILCSV